MLDTPETGWPLVFVLALSTLQRFRSLATRVHSMATSPMLVAISLPYRSTLPAPPMLPAPWNRLHRSLVQILWAGIFLLISVELTLGNPGFAFDLFPNFLGWILVARALGSIRDLSSKISTMRRCAQALVALNMLAIFNIKHRPPPSDYFNPYTPPMISNEMLDLVYDVRDALAWALVVLLVWKLLTFLQQIAEQNGAEILAQQAAFRRKLFCGAYLSLWLLRPILLWAPPIIGTILMAPLTILILVASVLVWAHLRNMSAWTRQYDQPNATWLKLTEEQEIEIVDRPQSHGWKFTISQMLMASVLLAILVSHWKLSQDLAEARQEQRNAEKEADRYLDQLQKLNVTQRSRIFVKRFTTNGDLWEWSIYIPPNADVVWRVKLNEIVFGELPLKGDGELALPAGNSLLIAQADLEKGLLKLEVRPSGEIYDLSGKQSVFTPQEATLEVSFDPSGWHGPDNSGTGSRDTISPELQQPCLLYQHRWNLERLTRQTSPCDGVQFWLDSADR